MTDSMYKSCSHILHVIYAFGGLDYSLEISLVAKIRFAYSMNSFMIIAPNKEFLWIGYVPEEIHRMQSV
jgi:hypothetical protein